MCFSRGAIGCCCKCTWRMDSFGGTFEEFRRLRNQNELGYSRSQVADDGSPLRCDGSTGQKRKPCLDMSHAVEHVDLYVAEDPGKHSWYNAGYFALFPAGWTYQPDGAAHTVILRADKSLRAISGSNVLGTSYVYTVEDDRETSPTRTDLQPLIFVRQGDEVYWMGFPGSNTRWEGGAIDDPFHPGPNLMGDWGRQIGSGSGFGGVIASTAHTDPRPWSTAEGDGTQWNRLLRDDEWTDYAYPTESTEPDNAAEAEPWEVGFGLVIGANQNPDLFGRTGRIWLEQAITLRIDSICVTLDPTE